MNLKVETKEKKISGGSFIQCEIVNRVGLSEVTETSGNKKRKMKIFRENKLDRILKNNKKLKKQSREWKFLTNPKEKLGDKARGGVFQRDG